MHDSARIRVLRVVARLNIGGPSLHVILLNSGLDPARYESHLVTGIENPGEGSMMDEALAAGLRPIVVPEIVAEGTLRGRDLVALGKLYRVMRRVRPQIVHTHTAKAGVLGRVAARLAGVPIVVHTYHGHILRGYFGRTKTYLLRRQEQVLARLSDRLIAVSEEVRRDLVRYGVAPAARVDVIPLGFHLAEFLTADAHRGALRAELGLSDGVPLVGIVGRIFPIKNHALFLDAARLVAAEEPSAHFLVVGDGALRKEMEEYADHLGIAGRVIFAGWRRDLPRVYADVDVLVVSSDNEGTPVSAIEAMAAGRPVVATRVGGLPDLIADGRTGYLVAPRNPAALAEALLRLFSDRSAAERMGRAAREAVRARYDAERLLSDIDDLYTRLLTAARVRGRLAEGNPVIRK